MPTQPSSQPASQPVSQPYGQPADLQVAGERSSVDVMEWVDKFLSVWYLYIICVGIALGLSMYANRKWVPTYRTAGTLIINEYGNNNNNALMQGFGVDVGYRNVNNQVIMMGSYDLMCRVVDSLPFMRTDYMSRGRFKETNLYRYTPVVFEPISLTAESYAYTYKLDIGSGGNLTVTIPDVEKMSAFKFTTTYGQQFDCGLFSGVFLPTEYLTENKSIYFRFRSRESLVGDFSSRLSLRFVADGASVLSIQMISATPQRDKEFIDKLCEIYLLQSLERKNLVAETTINFIDQQLDNIRKSLAMSESAMTEFRKRNEIVDIQSYSSELLGKVASYDQEKLTMRLRETYFDYLTNYLNTTMEQGTVIAPSTMGLDAQALTSLVTQLNDLQIKRSELSDKNIYYDKYTTDMQNVKKAILEVLKSMRASMDIEKRDLELRFREVRNGINQLPEKELEMVALERNYRIDDNYYTFFLQKRAESEIQMASNTPDNDILDKARILECTNAGAKNANRTKYLLIGLLLPFFYVFIRELLNNRVRSTREAENLSPYKVLAQVRHTRSSNPTEVVDHPRSSYAEQLRALRTRIEFVVRRKTGITVLTTSAQSGDGKTYLSTNLAALYAMSGKRTVLVDMDIRKPNIHEKLGTTQQKGLTNYLIGEITFDEMIQHDPSYQFDIIYAGTIPPNPGELIRSDQVSELLEKLQSMYDYVVIDSSPIGLVTDAYSLVEKADLTLFVIRFNKTQRSFCREVLNQLYDDGKRNVYIVFSDLPHERGGGYNYNSRSYHYGYGYGGYGYGSYGYGSYGYGYGYGYGSRKKKENHYYTDED